MFSGYLSSTSVNVLERIAIFDDVIFDGTVIDRTEYASVKRDSVGSNVTTFVPCLVSLHYLGGQAIEHYVLIISELLEAAERRLVGLGGSYLAVLFEFDDDTLHEVEQGIFVGVAVELVDYIIGCVHQAVGVKFLVNFVQSLDISTNALTDREDERLALTFMGGSNH